MLPSIVPDNLFDIKDKGHVCITSGDPPCRDGNARFTTILFTFLSDHINNVEGED